MLKDLLPKSFLKSLASRWYRKELEGMIESYKVNLTDALADIRILLDERNNLRKLNDRLLDIAKDGKDQVDRCLKLVNERDQQIRNLAGHIGQMQLDIQLHHQAFICTQIQELPPEQNIPSC